MKNQTQQGGRRKYRQRNRGGRDNFVVNREKRPPTFWEKIVSFFTGGDKPAPSSQARESSRSENSSRSSQASSAGATQQQSSPRTSNPRISRKPEIVEVTSARLYVGNLSFDAAESDLHELFNGVGQVQSAEVVTHRQTQRSKGFAFVEMQSIEEAKRAVTELHDKDFMGRKLVVSGAKAITEHND